jgi:hypothetical protein
MNRRFSDRNELGLSSDFATAVIALIIGLITFGLVYIFFVLGGVRELPDSKRDISEPALSSADKSEAHSRAWGTMLYNSVIHGTLEPTPELKKKLFAED